MGKTWVAEKISGEIKGDTVRSDFFDEKLSVKMQVLDTDYDKYLIFVRCLDNMSFALETELEPVHSIVVSIFTHDPEENVELIKGLGKTITKKSPSLTRWSSLLSNKEPKPNANTNPWILKKPSQATKRKRKGTREIKLRNKALKARWVKTKRWRNLKVKSNLERASQSKKETLKVMCQKRARSAGKLKMKRSATKRINECFIS